MLKPLEQWFCDKCGDVIESPDDGYVEWIGDGGYHVFGFKIIHSGGRCHHYAAHPELSDSPLRDFLGTEGVIQMLRWLDAGPQHDTNYKGPHVPAEHMREFVEVFRRLHVEHYEEARKYHKAAKRAGELIDMNEVYIYLPSTNKRIIEQYADD